MTSLATDRVQVPYPSKREANLLRKKCVVLLNEILTSQPSQPAVRVSRHQFIEIAKICGSGAVQDARHDMDDYVLLTVEYLQILAEGPPTPAITFTARLLATVMKADPELLDGKTVFYHTIGISTPPHNGTKYSLNMEDPAVYHPRMSQGERSNIIPPETDSPTVILLLKYNRKTQSELMKTVTLTRDKNNQVAALPLTLPRIDIIKSLLVDSFVYGTSLTQNQANDLGLIHDVFVANPEAIIFSSKAMKGTSIDPHSFSRCAQNNFPLQMSSFRPAIPTPGRNNDCSQPLILEHPYHFRGVPLQSTAQKLITNCLYSMKLLKSDESLTEGTPYEITARVLGISSFTIAAITDRAKQGDLLTPGKTRQRKCPVQIRIDAFDREKIRKFIVDSYKSNIVPQLLTIYNLFMRSKDDEWNNEQRRHLQNPLLVPPPGPKFTCSEKTFRKFLHIMGFKYGRVSGRDGIVQRPDIVNLRGRFLGELRKNEALDKPLPLVYLDETCVFMSYNRTWITSFHFCVGK
jgi:hypothetical protein